MSTSKITLFKTDLVPTKYWKLDNIEAYLSTCTSEEVKGAKYLKPDLTNTIKLPKGQQYLSVNGLKFNYLRCCTTEDDDTIHNEYYFINNYDWGGKKCITLALQLDTLNTIDGTKMSAITQIIREHQDRWKKVGNKYYPIIDKYDEGIAPLKQIGTKAAIETRMMYLVQISKNATTPDTIDTHPYDTYICYDDAVQFAAAGTGTTKKYYAEDLYNSWTNKVTGMYCSGTVHINSYGSERYNATIGNQSKVFNDTTGILRAIKLETSVTLSQGVYTATVNVKEYYYSGDTYPYSYLGEWTNQYSFSNSGTAGYIELIGKFMYQVNKSQYIWESCTALDVLMNASTQYTINSGDYAARITTKFSDLDRTNNSIMSIYPVPYRAFTTSNATFVEGYNLIKPNYWNEFQVSSTAINGFESSTLPTSESKLLAPEFLDIQLTLNGDVVWSLDTTTYSTGSALYLRTSLTYDRDTPNEIMFNFNSSQLNWRSFDEHYSLYTNKYNLPLFTNEWTEYVRNGYNYDAAELAKNKRMQGWNIALNTISAASSLIPGIGKVVYGITKNKLDYTMDAVNHFAEYTRNPKYHSTHIKRVGTDKFQFIGTYKDTDGNDQNFYEDYDRDPEKFKYKFAEQSDLSKMVTMQGLDTISSAISTGYAIQTSQKNYQYNINSRATSKTTLTGTSYNLCYQKGLYLEYWKPEQYLLDNIEKVFYLTGYNHPVQEVPNTKSRKLFNYLQCIPTWTEDTINGYRPEFLNDLSAKYQAGVTIFHTSDLTQQGNNQEVNL